MAIGLREWIITAADTIEYQNLIGQKFKRGDKLEPLSGTVTLDAVDNNGYLSRRGIKKLTIVVAGHDLGDYFEL